MLLACLKVLQLFFFTPAHFQQHNNNDNFYCLESSTNKIKVEAKLERVTSPWKKFEKYIPVTNCRCKE